MIHEKSCGAVIYTVSNGERLYLIERMQKGHTSICKGHVEGEETEHETAAREIREETALQVRFIDGFRRTIEYSPYGGCLKEVVFFLAKASDAAVTAQPEEVRSIEWLPIEDALTELTHLSDRQTLLAAERFLNERSGLTEFRPMRRKGRELSGAECEDILERGTSGVLALEGDEGFPYAVPLSYVYAGGKIYFHCAKSGHKLDAARRSKRASFCVVDRDDVEPESYTTRYRSVIVFGRLRELTGGELPGAIELLAGKYYPEDTPEHRRRYIDAEIDGMAMLELAAEHMTGKSNIPARNG